MTYHFVPSEAGISNRNFQSVWEEVSQASECASCLADGCFLSGWREAMEPTKDPIPRRENIHFRWMPPLEPVSVRIIMALAVVLAVVFWWTWVRAFVFHGWQGWLKDFPGASLVRRDQIGISFILYTMLTGFILAWAWHLRTVFWKKCLMASILIVFGLAAPMLAAAAHLLTEAHWPPGWQGDLIRAGVIIFSPALCLLTAMRVMLRNPGCDALRLRGFAFLGGWLFLPVYLMRVENRNLEQAFVHFTHPYFATVLTTLISLMIVLVCEWKCRHASWTAIFFALAGLTAASPVLRQYGHAVNYGFGEPSEKGSLREEIVIMPGIGNNESTILAAISDISHDDRRELVFQIPAATLPPDRTVITEGTRILSIAQADEGIANTLPLQPQVSLERKSLAGNDPPAMWTLRLHFHGRMAQRIHGNFKLEGSHSGLLGHPVPDLQFTAPGAAWIPGLGFWWQINPLDQYGERFRHSSVGFSWSGWCPHGAWQRDSFNPAVEPFALLRTRNFLPVFSPAPPIAYEWRGRRGGDVTQRRFGVGGGMYRNIRWHVFPWAEYKALSAQERKIKREERLALLENWRKSATLVPHEVTGTFNIPVSLFLHIP